MYENFFLHAHLCMYVIITDFNECWDNNGNCSHDCVNTVSSYYCECPAGYNLQPNKHKCEGEFTGVANNRLLHCNNHSIKSQG